MITHIYAVVEYWGNYVCSGKEYHYFSLDEADCIKFVLDNDMLENKKDFDKVEVEKIPLGVRYDD